MKIWTSEHVFDHPWEAVVLGALRKYPNPATTSVVGVDVLERQTGVLPGTIRSNRIIKTMWRIPQWATALIGLDNPCYSYEFSEINRNKREMKLESQNIDCQNFISIDESLLYKPHPHDPSRTLLEQSTSITVRNVPLIGYMESMLESMVATNTATGRQGLEWVINKLKEEYDELTKKVAVECTGITKQLTQQNSQLLRGFELKFDLDEQKAGSTTR